MTLTAGIDAGTQSVKVVVYDDLARRVVASKSAALELFSGEDGSREQHPDAWTQAIRQCFAGIDSSVRSQIKAIAVSGQQHGFVLLDAEGEVLDVLVQSRRNKRAALKTHAQAFEEVWLCPRQAGHGRTKILCCRCQ